MIKKGIPIPVGFLTDNRRSLLNLDNLIDLITECVLNPSASNQLFLASDDIQRSTKDIVYLFGEVDGLKPKIVGVPIFMLKLFGMIFRKSEMVKKLVTSLEVDIGHTKATLDWQPPIR
jgi:nucleoside-diphosphate-sugar epimerase